MATPDALGPRFPCPLTLEGDSWIGQSTRFVLILNYVLIACFAAIPQLYPDPRRRSAKREVAVAPVVGALPHFLSLTQSNADGLFVQLMENQHSMELPLEGGEGEGEGRGNPSPLQISSWGAAGGVSREEEEVHVVTPGKVSNRWVCLKQLG